MTKMEYIQTFYIPEGKDVFVDSFGWIAPEFHLMSWALSCNLLKDKFDGAKLYANTAGAEILADILQLPYNEFTTCLDDFPKPHDGLWALPKIYTYSLQQSPFLHVDGDVFMFYKLPEKLLYAKLIAQNPEVATNYYTDTQRQLAKNLTYFPDVVRSDFENMNKISAVNAGILGGSDIKFIQSYAHKAIEYVEKNKENLSKIDTDKFNVFFEQHLFRAMADSCGKKIDYLFNDIVNDNAYTFLGNFHETPERRYLHLLGHYKRDIPTCLAMAAKLRELYPKVYYRILNIFIEKGIKLFTDFYNDKNIDENGGYFSLTEKANYMFCNNVKQANETNVNLEKRALATTILFAEKAVYDTFKNSEQLTDALVEFKNLKQRLLNIVSNLCLSDSYLYGRELNAQTWSHILLATKSQNLQLSRVEGLSVITTNYNFGGIIGKASHCGTEYYDTLDGTTKAKFLNLILPDPYFGIMIYDIDDIENFVLEQLQQPLTMQELLKRCENICEPDVLREYYDRYSRYILEVVRSLVLKRAVYPQRLNLNSTEITVEKINNVWGKHSDNFSVKEYQKLEKHYAIHRSICSRIKSHVLHLRLFAMQHNICF